MDVDGTRSARKSTYTSPLLVAVWSSWAEEHRSPLGGHQFEACYRWPPRLWLYSKFRCEVIIWRGKKQKKRKRVHILATCWLTHLISFLGLNLLWVPLTCIVNNRESCKQVGTIL